MWSGNVAADGVQRQRRRSRRRFPRAGPSRDPTAASGRRSWRCRVRRSARAWPPARPRRSAASIGLFGIDASPAKRSGCAAAEVGEPLVVDAHDLDGGLGIVEAAARAEHAVQHLGLHAVTVLILDPQVRIGEAADPSQAVVVEPVAAMRSARWILPGTYWRPAEPMPFIMPRLAPRFVVHIRPFGPSVTCGIRSRSAAEALVVKRSGGSQQRSTWQSAEIRS